MPEQTLSARELILTLMDSATGGALPASYLVAAGRLFDMDSGSIRVALARLVKDGSLTTEARGEYRLGTRAGQLHHLLRNWAQVETSVKPWRGDWLGVMTAHLKRANKTMLRGRERALNLYGFAELHSGLWVRPDNLAESLTGLHGSLVALGLDADASAFVMSRPVRAPEPATLWNIRELEAGYRSRLQALAASSARLPELSQIEAAKETLLLGRAVTREILLDPLLPDELVDTQLRGEMVAAMRRYDRDGKALWRNYYRSHIKA